MQIQQTLYRRLLYRWGCRKILGSFGESRNLVFGGIGISVKIRVQLPAPPPAPLPARRAYRAYRPEGRPEPYGSESRAYSSERGVILVSTFASSVQVSGVRHKKVSGFRCQVSGNNLR